MTINVGDMYLFTSFKGNKEHCIIVELIDSSSYSGNMWSLFVIEKGTYDKELESELLKGIWYERVA